MKLSKPGAIAVGIYLGITAVLVIVAGTCKGWFCGLGALILPVIPWVLWFPNVLDSWTTYSWFVALNGVILYMVVWWQTTPKKRK